MHVKKPYQIIVYLHIPIVWPLSIIIIYSRTVLSVFLQEEFGSEKLSSAEDDATTQFGPQTPSTEFWYKMLYLMVSVIEEDKNVYTPLLNQ